MEWSDEGVVLSARPLGESSSVLSLLTRAHGRHGGLLRGASGARGRTLRQPGTRVAARWRGRLAEQLGTYACEFAGSVAPSVLSDRHRLAGIAAACAVAETALPEREPCPRLYAGLLDLVAAIEAQADWPAAYVRWELSLLAELGYGLDLESCALTGSTSDLAYVSPRSGRAVSAAAAGPWKDRLLALPAFVRSREAVVDGKAVRAGLALTGAFLRRHVYADARASLPPARDRLADELDRLFHAGSAAAEAVQR